MNLIQVLVSRDDEKKDDVEGGTVDIEDYEGFANMVNGHGADGHTLAHWCAKRGECLVVLCI
jgi:hypothetical protein